MAGHAQLLLLLFISTSIGSGLCERIFDWGDQDAGTCTFQRRNKAAEMIGTRISAVCNRHCTIQALQKQEERSVIGTKIYGQDSEPCLAAIHDARLPHPATWSAGREVALEVVQSVTDFFGSFRRGVQTSDANRAELGLVFVSEKVAENVPDITTVHAFRFREGDEATDIECHVGAAENLDHIRFFLTSGEEPRLLVEPENNYQDLRGAFKHLSWYRGSLKTPRSLVCRLDETLYSDTTTMEFLTNSFLEPSQLVYHNSIKDHVTMKIAPGPRQPGDVVWSKDGKRLDRRGEKIVIDNVQTKDAGMYYIQLGEDKRGASATRLIVRDCPSNFFGTECGKRCPYCFHGGQCHDVTGECVCPAGFIGSRCERSCQKAQFGRNCSSLCPDNNCKGRLLCVPDPYGCSCASGWRGTRCDDECPLNSYGPNCAFECGGCKNKDCDKFTGACNQGCESDRLSPPLCLKLSVWFRDPPTVVQVGYTNVQIQHPVWTADYDNGFGSGTYGYIVQYRRQGATGEWITPKPKDATSSTQGGIVSCQVAGLEPNRTYSLRILVEDRGRSLTEDEALVRSVKVTTDCAAPGRIKGVDVKKVTKDSSVIMIKDLMNEAEVCGYELQVRTTDEGGNHRDTQETRRLGHPTLVTLQGLSPYTNYTVTVTAKARKGSSPPYQATFTTHEAAPSRVNDVTVKESPGLQFEIKWKPPSSPNGVIRRYQVEFQHVEYRACSKKQKKDTMDTFSQEVKMPRLKITLKHPFSKYAVSIAAVTVERGPSRVKEFSTTSQGPSDGAQIYGDERGKTWITFRAKEPDCTAWNDHQAKLRLYVVVDGRSPWNLDFHKTYSLGLSNPRINGLVPFTEYSLAIYLNNSAGGHPKPSFLNTTTRQSKPGAPVNLTVLTVSSKSISIGWDPPFPPFARITGYRVVVRSYVLSYDKYVELDACSADTGASLLCAATTEDLQENTNYTLVVSAYSSDIQQYSQEQTVTATTREGRPGPPEDLRIEKRRKNMLNISWQNPIQRNGIIVNYFLSFTYPSDHFQDNTNALPRTRNQTIKACNRQEPSGVMRCFYVQQGLQPGRQYQVRVAASTSAGYGEFREASFHTLVAPPVIPRRPRVLADQVTDTSVPLSLPPVPWNGGPAPEYFVVVSKDLDFDGSQLTPSELPNADEARSSKLDFYVTGALDQEYVTRHGEFVVGDGRYYNSTVRHYHNKPLETGETLRMGMAVVSRISDDNQDLSFKWIAEPVTVHAPNDAGVIVGSLFAVLVLLALLVGAVLLYRRRHASGSKTGNGTAGTTGAHPRPAVPRQPTVEEMYEPPMERDGAEPIYENVQLVQINLTRIQLSDLAEVVKTNEENGQLKAQIANLPTGLARPCEYGRQLPNRAKNRYGNLIAYDDTRVILDKFPDDEFSDYINACYIDGYNRPAAYIATQGPKEATVADFWRMVWEKRVERIVMLTNLVEGGKRKCDQYWPDETLLELPGMTVHKHHERFSNDFTVRTFWVVKDDQRRTVTQLHYTAWPDHSVPMYPRSLAKFMREMDSVPDGGAPTVVHCSAGVGRTGTVILIDAMYQMGRQERAVDVYSHLSVARQQRANFCANYQQYQLVHEVLVELLVSPNTAVPAAELAVRLPQLKSMADGPSQLEQQLVYLDANPPVARYASALAERLEGKNRSPEILPEDKSRVFLHGNLHDNYINAVYVPGFKSPEAFIATEAPLPGRRKLFWHMVDQKSTQTLVVIDDLESDDVFWPEAGEKIVYSNMSVETKSGSSSGQVEIIDLVLRTFKKDKSVSTLDVRLLRLPTDSMAGKLPTPEGLAQLFSVFERSQPANMEGPTVVICRNGVTGCGLFLATCFTLARTAEEQEVDVVMAVSTIRKSRPQFISGLKQFELCYDAALAWLRAFEIYSNFQ